MSNAVNEKALKRMKIHSIAFRIFGWIVALPFGILTIAGFSTLDYAYELTYDVILFCFTLAGVWMIKRGRLEKRIIVQCPVYASIIFKNEGYDLNRIASAIGVAPKKLKHNLRLMIRYGIYSGEMPQESKPIAPPIESIASKQSEQEHLTLVVCPCCGARNKVPQNSVSECEYCKAKISSAT